MSNPVRYPESGTAVMPQVTLHAGNVGYKGPPVWSDLPTPAEYFGPGVDPKMWGGVPAPAPWPELPLPGDPVYEYRGAVPGTPPRQNPKNVMGRKRLPIFSVFPASVLLEVCKALQYGAFEAPKADGSKGYGPQNWRDEKIELLGYIDANGRHIARWVDGQDLDKKSGAHELAHAIASLVIALDAILNKTAIDDRRPNGGLASKILDNYESQRKE